VANADGSIVVNANDIQVGVISDAQHGNRGGGSLHAVAGGGSSGFMTDAQATKLAGIASGATAEVDAANGVAGRINLSDQRLGDGNKEADSLGVLEAEPGAPAAGSRLWAWKKAKVLPAHREALGISSRLQNFLGGRRVNWVRPRGGGDTAIETIGTDTTNTGSVTSPALATTNILTQSQRALCTAAVATPTACEHRENVLRYWRGNAAGLGGFYFVCRFGLSVISANRRWMCGLGATTGTYSSANDPSAAINAIWFGQDTADTNIQAMHNDNAGACTKQDTGIAVPTTSELMEVHLYCAPNSSEVEMYFEKLNGGASYSYTASSNIPANTQLMNFHLWNGSGAGLNTQVAVDLVWLYVETDF
jgi:hypothetical protein